MLFYHPENSLKSTESIGFSQTRQVYTKMSGVFYLPIAWIQGMSTDQGSIIIPFLLGGWG